MAKKKELPENMRFMKNKAPVYSYKPSKFVKLKKLPVQQQIVKSVHRKRRVVQDGELATEEKYAAFVIVILFFAAVYYLITR